MSTIQSGKLPETALLQNYARDGAFTDCYFLDLPGSISLADYVTAFYTSRLFKLERLILSIAMRKRTTDDDARELALARTARFSFWTVEGRTDEQLLLRDMSGSTRSWLKVEARSAGETSSTRLYFGSAVVPRSRDATGTASFGFAFHALSGFHRLYSRALMRSACARLLHAAAVRAHP